MNWWMLIAGIVYGLCAIGLALMFLRMDLFGESTRTEFLIALVFGLFWGAWLPILGAVFLMVALIYPFIRAGREEAK